MVFDANPTAMTAEQLIAEHIRLSDQLKEAAKKFADFCAPWKARQAEIDAELLSLLNGLGGGEKASIATDVGTAYVSNILNVSIDPEGSPYVNEAGQQQVGRMALLDFCLENWAEIGQDLLLVQPQKDAVRRYLDESGAPPPGLKTSWFSKVNVRRS